MKNKSDYIHLLKSALPCCSLFLLMPALFLFADCSGAKRPLAHKPSLKLASVFCDNMVLQRGKKSNVWGWSNPNEEIIISFSGKTYKGVSDRSGSWTIEIGPLTEKDKGMFEVKSPSEAVCINDVLVGEVWLCSGQSNMEWTIWMCGEHPAYVKIKNEANYPEIRMLAVPHAICYSPQQDIHVKSWMPCNAQNIANYSAVAYFFALNLHKKLNVPIGVICSSFGGTPIQAWMSPEALGEFEDYKIKIREASDKEGRVEQLKKEYPIKLMEWELLCTTSDKALKEGKADWTSQFFSDSGWKTMNLPTVWENAGLPDFDGVVWFKKEFDIPEGWLGKKLTLSLGPIDDEDMTYINGNFVGGIRQWDKYRLYDIPAKYMKSGKNEITVRILDTGGAGGIYGKPEDMKLTLSGDSGKTKPIMLFGDWQYKVSYDLKTLPPKPTLPENPNDVNVLYNGMISPLKKYGIAGAIWYQGESDTPIAYRYKALFPAMIMDWRKQFGQGEFPFLFVQLANFMAVKDVPGESDWAELREAQLLTLSVPKTAMAVAIDIGEAEDIHPKNKWDVGDRLALGARVFAYGENIECSGPLYKEGSLKIEGNKIRLSFLHAQNGLMTKNSESIKGFAIAGSDKKFVFAEAKIEGDSVLVWSDKIEEPAAVRYAWANNPICNLYNKEGLPASPFRTDKWKGVTEK